MNNQFDWAKELPTLLTGKELMKQLTLMPEYSPDIREKSQAERLVSLSDIYQIYIPSTMGMEIYGNVTFHAEEDYKISCTTKGGKLSDDTR